MESSCVLELQKRTLQDAAILVGDTMTVCMYLCNYYVHCIRTIANWLRILQSVEIVLPVQSYQLQAELVIESGCLNAARSLRALGSKKQWLEFSHNWR